LSHNGISATINEKKTFTKEARIDKNNGTMHKKMNQDSSHNHPDKSPHRVTIVPPPTPVPAENNTTD
jgi:hypothetical protein